MWNREACDVEVADRKATAGLKGLERRLVFAPVDVGRGAVRQIDRNRTLAGLRQSGQTANVIVMLVCYQNGVERSDILPNGKQAFRDLAAAEARVNQNAGTAGGNERRITGAAARENANLDDEILPIALFG